MKRLLIMGLIAGMTVCALSAEKVSAEKVSAEKVSAEKVSAEKVTAGVLPAEYSTDSTITPQERDALTFLYRYMSDPDAAGYSPAFYLENVRSSLQAMREMPWGDSVPRREFMHFVLPLRVNNEALDMSRPAFYAELKERVKNLSMKDAILEVNHWCHEKVTYRPSDGRTSSPLSSVSQAIGRCGEESTFAVAALRSVGIPARQVYTPRWAHTDDNHAWVEAWADGQWHFIGACEPEPVLDLAWFNAPASRGMLMNTNVFGLYDGPEEQLDKKDIITTINVTSNYAPVKTGRVRVVDSKGNPVPDATVRFGIYNYAEFYPVVTRRTDVEGMASLNSGLGDMVVWASDGHNFNLGLLKGNDREPMTLVLDKDSSYTGNVTFDITPPPSRHATTTVTDMQRAANSVRLAYEDSVRGAYEGTFATRDDAYALADSLGMDRERLCAVLTESRGNHRMIENMFAAMKPAERITALALLENVSEKDRRDIPVEVIAEHVRSFSPVDNLPKDFQYKYILNPRVENERLTPYKNELASFVPESRHAEFIANPALLAEWLESVVKVDAGRNPVSLRMDPVSTASLGRSDALSRKILFVATARSLGIPARMDLVRGVAQYADSSCNWYDVLRDDVADNKNVRYGTMHIAFQPQGYLKNPGYYYYFTISRIENGLPVLLEYPETGTYSSLFADDVRMETGQYMLVTGQRLADGGVLANVRFFDIREGERTELPLEIRQDNSMVSVIGSLNSEDTYRDLKSGEPRSILSAMGRGYYVLGIIRNGHEPSVHTLNDISLLKEAFDRQATEMGEGGKILLLFREGDAVGFRPEQYPDLPKGVAFGEDIDGKILQEIRQSLNLENLTETDLPLFVIADTFNRIVYVSQGYSIGLGDRLLGILSRIK